MLRNPAYAGRAGYLKTMRFEQRARVNRTARRQGQSVSRHAMSRPRDRRGLDHDRRARHRERGNLCVGRRVASKTTVASRRATPKSRRCSWDSWRVRAVATRTTGHRRAPRSASSTTTAALVLMTTAMSTDVSARTSRCEPTTLTISSGARSLPCWPIPLLVQAELDRRLAELRHANPATAERTRLELDLARTTKGIERLVGAYQEDLLTLDELRARMPELRDEGDEPERRAGGARCAASRPRHLPCAGREPRGVPHSVA